MPGPRMIGLESDIQAKSKANPLLNFVSNSELEQQEAARQAAIEAQNNPVITSLAAFVQRCWQEAKTAKQEVEAEMLRDYRQRRGEYDPDVLAKIKEKGGSEIYMMLTAIKCEALEAWLLDVIFQPGDKSWQLEPSPISDLPPDIEQEIRNTISAQAQQAYMANGAIDIAAMRDLVEKMRDEARNKIQAQAEKAAKRMEEQVDDDLTESGWEAAIEGAISDVVTTKAGFIHGPVYRSKERLQWVETPDGWQAQKTRELVKVFERASPFDIYPSPDAQDIDDGYLIHHQRLTPYAIEQMKGVPGFDTTAIEQALMEYQRGGLRTWLSIDTQRRDLEQRSNTAMHAVAGTIDTLSFWGKLPGELLLEYGLSEEDGIEKTRQYEVNIWQIGNWTIGLTLDQTIGGKRPYSKASFRRIPGSFWGEGLPHEIRDCQEACNGAGRETMNNAGLASGPQVALNDTTRLPANTQLESIYPWKIWQFGPDKVGTTNRPPIEFFQPPLIVAQLMDIYDRFSGIADQVSGVPNYSYGDTDVGGAGSTASGLSMLMTNASRGIKRMVKRIDTEIIRRTVWMTYATNMIYLDDEAMKGDLNVVVRGASSLIAKEQQQIRRTEFLEMTNNPTDLQITGIAGRATVLRETAKSLDLPLDDVVQDPEGLRAQEEQARAQQMLMALAVALNIPPEALMQMMQQGMQVLQQNGGQMPQQQQLADPRALAPDGRPVAGQDTRLFG